MSEAIIAICVRTEDLAHPSPGALPAPCRSCGKMVWRSVPTLRITGRVEYQCVPCVAADRSLDPSTFILPDDTYAEVVRHTGPLSREEVKAGMVSEIRRMRGDR